jgi:hypothetical protein
MTDRTYQALLDDAERALTAGHSVVADAVFARPEQRQAIEAVARRLGVPFDGLWLQADPELMRQRIETRRANASDATAEVLEQQLAYDLGAMAWPRIDASGPKAETLANAKAALRLC